MIVCDSRIATATCVLRPWNLGDVAALPALANDEAVARYLALRFPHPYERSDAETWVAINMAKDVTTHFAIESDGIPIGGIGLELGSDINRKSAEIGYWLGRAFWGRGFMTAAVRALTENVFARSSLQRLWAPVMAPNDASMRVLENAGYTREAVLRSAFSTRADEVVDGVIYARLRTDGANGRFS